MTSELNCSIVEPFEVPKTRVELHIHLDGAFRQESLWEILRKKAPEKLPGNGSLSAFSEAIRAKKPYSLAHFLSGFRHFCEAYLDDLEVIDRLTYEFCQDQASRGIAYCEARFSPLLMVTGTTEVTAEHVTETVVKAVQRGQKDFGIKVRLILCCIRGLGDPKDSLEIVKLCQRFSGLDGGVVGIDVAGDEATSVDASGGLTLDPMEIEAFAEARKTGIHRTVHAGEAGPAQSVAQALDGLGAERIGHGYRVLEDEKIYQRCLKENIHFETCPTSSILTGAVSMDKVLSHPVVKFALDGANFSLNSDDPTVTETGLPEEIELVQKWGLTEVHITKAAFNAIDSSFLPEDERKEIRKQMAKKFGFE